MWFKYNLNGLSKFQRDFIRIQIEIQRIRYYEEGVTKNSSGVVTPLIKTSMEFQNYNDMDFNDTGFSDTLRSQ